MVLPLPHPCSDSSVMIEKKEEGNITSLQKQKVKKHVF